MKKASLTLTSADLKAEWTNIVGMGAWYYWRDPYHLLLTISGTGSWR